jgi:hypothetical protein
MPDAKPPAKAYVLRGYEEIIARAKTPEAQKHVSSNDV